MTKQLLPYDYSVQSDIDTLKLKLWVLDGAPLAEETDVLDTDYDNPIDHVRWLKAEIEAVDLYIRTEEDTLEEGEDTFKNSQRNKRDFLKEIQREINEDTGVRWRDYEVDYESRPTSLTDAQLATLHTTFKSKRSNTEMTSFTETFTKVPEYNIDQLSTYRELAQDTWVHEDIQKEQITEIAITDQDREDKQLVAEMNIVYDEIFDLISTLAPTAISFDTYDSGTTYSKGDIVESGGLHYISNSNGNTNNLPPDPDWDAFGDPWDSGITYKVGSQVEDNNDLYVCTEENDNNDPSSNLDKWLRVKENDTDEWVQDPNDLVIANFPTKRAQVVMVSDDASHRGIYISTHSIGGGFRHGYIKISDGAHHNDDGEPIPQSESGTGISGDLWDDNELTMTDWRLAEFLYSEGSNNYYRDLGIDRSSLPSISTSTLIAGSVSVERNDELVQRWETLNHFREANLQGTGTRIALEGMVSAQIPDLLPDYTESFEQSKQMKASVINILKERLTEFA